MPWGAGPIIDVTCARKSNKRLTKGVRAPRVTPYRSVRTATKKRPSSGLADDKTWFISANLTATSIISQYHAGQQLMDKKQSYLRYFQIIKVLRY